MPHIKFDKNGVKLQNIYKEPPTFHFSIKEKDISFKFDGSYLRNDERELLFYFVVVEGRLIQHILLSLIEEDNIYLLKLKKNAPVLRTYGVKLLFAIIGNFLEKKGMKIIDSSLNPYIEEGKFYFNHLNFVNTKL